jgi:anti-sigma regulatory factor (Ser/Thr protein kinase)
VVERWVAELAREEALAPELAYRVDLCLTEVVSNVVRHGLAQQGGEPVRVSAWREGVELRVAVVDDGRPFDPLAHPLPPAAQRLEDVGPQGFGLSIVLCLADHLVYTRREGVNQLVLGFRPR